MHPAVVWPRAWEGDYVQGHAQVRTYWTQQWQEISPSVEPVEVSRLPDGRIAVLVRLTVWDLSGKLLQELQTRVNSTDGHPGRSSVSASLKDKWLIRCTSR
uniref:Uncharacterized protein n=1 Tax=Tanacetum cinerariifolium TaxID=118510 RepID=A0A699RA04_TANCI|nr:hypothetical protein [Tanacetum cinerariifolium]